MKTIKRSLYQCGNAKVKDKEIYCSAGAKLSSVSKTGNIGIGQLARGKPLEISVCQDCNSYDKTGPPVQVKDRGWL